MQVRALAPEEVVKIYGMETYLGFNADVPYVVAGFRREGQRLWAFLDPIGEVPALPLVKAIKAILNTKHEPVSVVCEKHKYPNAPRLLTLLGFKAVDEMQYGMRVWTWHRSR